MSDAPGPSLQTLEVGPEEAGASVIWLHGLGADGWDFQPIVPELGLPASLALRFVFPHAPRRPVTLNGGMPMRAWYDIAELSLSARSFDEEGIRESAGMVEELVARERDRGVPSERIVLGGFSQGGALAMHVALRARERLAGLVALSCYLLLPERLESEASAQSRSLPIFMGHGEEDPVVPLQAGEQTRDRLVAAGYSPRFETYPMPHAVHPREIADVGAWIEERLG
jgi:phospholipase/carboxylesterase